MTMNPSVIGLFRKATTAWTVLYMVAMLGLGDAAWFADPVRVLSAGAPGADAMNGLLAVIDPLVGRILCAVVLLVGLWRWRSTSVAVGLLLWTGFKLVEWRTWLASNGGIQLMANMLLWSALMSPAERSDQGAGHGVALFAWWAARAQLVIVYAVTVVHKALGHAWPDGTAVLMVAADPDFHLQWLLAWPSLCTGLAHAAFAFMFLFPFAVWWPPARRIALCVGAIFHLATGFFMDIPQMGLAFLACYPIWLDGDEVAWLRSRTLTAVAARR